MGTKFIANLMMFERAAVFSALVVFIIFGYLGWQYYQAVESHNQLEIAR